MNNFWTHNYCLYNIRFVPTYESGFQTTGVLCWCNSLLQMLLSIPSLSETLLNETGFVDNILALEYIKTIKIANNDKETQKLHNLPGQSTKILKAFNIAAHRKNMNNNFSINQQDVQEAFLAFIDIFDKPSIYKLFELNYTSRIDCDICDETVMYTNNINYCLQMFPVNNINTNKKFNDWLISHTSTSDDCYKASCGHLIPRYNTHVFGKQRSEVIIILFRQEGKTNISIIPQVLIFPSHNGTKLQYKLITKVIHTGDRNGGHWWVHVFRRGKWIYISDTTIKEGNGNYEDHIVMVVYHMEKVI